MSPIKQLAVSVGLCVALAPGAEAMTLMTVLPEEPAPTTQFDPGHVDALADAFIARMDSAAYQYSTGSFVYIDETMCQRAKDHNEMNCLAMNPETPYGVVTFAPEAAARSLIDWEYVVETMPAGEMPAFFLRRDEAVVLLGLTPPESRFWSFTPYVASRTEPLNSADPDFSAVFPGQWADDDGTIIDASRLDGGLVDILLGSSFVSGQRDYLASVAQAVNKASVKTVGSGHQTPFVVIMSADQTTLDETRRWLELALADLKSSGDLVINGDVINEIPMPAEGARYYRVSDERSYDLGMRYGHDPDADRFSFFSRDAFPADKAVTEAYRQNPPFRVLKLRPRLARSDGDYRAADYSLAYTEDAERRQGWRESDEVSVQLALLRSNFATQVRRMGYEREWLNKPVNLLPISQGFEGYRGLDLGFGTIGDSPDAIYGFGIPFRLPSDDHVVAFFGVNHAYASRNGQAKSTYSSLTLYEENLGALASLSDEEMVGSARHFMQPSWMYPSDIYDEALYVGFFANDCEQHPELANIKRDPATGRSLSCKSIATGDALQDLGYAANDPVRVAERIYLKSDGVSRNHPDEIMGAMGVVFRRR